MLSTGLSVKGHKLKPYTTHNPPSSNFNQVSAGGLVRDPAVHRAVIDHVLSTYAARGFAPQQCIPSPIKGANAGNTEFLAHLVYRPQVEEAGP